MWTYSIEMYEKYSVEIYVKMHFSNVQKYAI